MQYHKINNAELSSILGSDFLGGEMVWWRGDRIPRHCITCIRELKQRRRRQLQKRHLKSKFELLQSLLPLSHLVRFVKYWLFFSGVDF